MILVRTQHAWEPRTVWSMFKTVWYRFVFRKSSDKCALVPGACKSNMKSCVPPIPVHTVQFCSFDNPTNLQHCIQQGTPFITVQGKMSENDAKSLIRQDSVRLRCDRMYKGVHCTSQTSYEVSLLAPTAAWTIRRHIVSYKSLPFDVHRSGRLFVCAETVRTVFTICRVLAMENFQPRWLKVVVYVRKR